MAEYEKRRHFGVRFLVLYEDKGGAGLAARINCIPVGIEFENVGNGWGVVFIQYKEQI